MRRLQRFRGLFCALRRACETPGSSATRVCVNAVMQTTCFPYGGDGWSAFKAHGSYYTGYSGEAHRHESRVKIEILTAEAEFYEHIPNVCSPPSRSDRSTNP